VAEAALAEAAEAVSAGAEVPSSKKSGQI